MLQWYTHTRYINTYTTMTTDIWYIYIYFSSFSIHWSFHHVCLCVVFLSTRRHVVFFDWGTVFIIHVQLRTNPLTSISYIQRPKTIVTALLGTSTRCWELYLLPGGTPSATGTIRHLHVRIHYIHVVFSFRDLESETMRLEQRIRSAVGVSASMNGLDLCNPLTNCLTHRFSCMNDRLTRSAGLKEERRWSYYLACVPYAVLGCVGGRYFSRARIFVTGPMLTTSMYVCWCVLRAPKPHPLHTNATWYVVARRRDIV